MLAVYLWLKNLFANEKGQDLIEYALIIAVMIVIAVLGLTLLGSQISELWFRIGTWLGTYLT